MKKKFIGVAFFVFSNVAFSQQSNSFNVDPYFSAIVVKNIDSSVYWYSSVFGLKPRFLSDVPAGFKVAILESPKIVIEMIENNSWPDPKELLKEKPGANLQGYFKIGFRISSMDNFIEHLKGLNITIQRVYKDEAGKRNFLVEDPDKNLVQFFE